MKKHTFKYASLAILSSTGLAFASQELCLGSLFPFNVDQAIRTQINVCYKCSGCCRDGLGLFDSGKPCSRCHKKPENQKIVKDANFDDKPHTKRDMSFTRCKLRHF